MIDWDLIKSILDGTATNAEEAKLKEWLEEDTSHVELLSELRERWQKEYQLHSPSKTDAAYQQFKKRLANPKLNTATVIPFKQLMTIAATVLLLLTAGLYYYFHELRTPEVRMITKATHVDQRASILLPDGTSVRLNIGSSLTFPEVFGTAARNVELTGEAFFEVSKDPKRPFTITSGEVKTTVLGTTFNIRAYANENIDVTVKEGKVSVSSANASETLIHGEQALFNRSNLSLTKSKVNIEKHLGWTYPTLIFDLIPFEEVIEQLGRWYHLEITYKGTFDDSCLIRGTYKNMGITRILSGLQHVVDFEFENKEPNQLIINSKGCID